MGRRKITINDVCPRDGFQNIPEFIDTDTKLAIIDGIVQSGVRKIQCTSFTSPKAIPQLRDSVSVASACLEKYGDSGIEFYALVPNHKGAQIARDTGFSKISFVTSVTESHNLSNVRKSVAQSVEELRAIVTDFPDLEVAWDVAMAFGCCFEGPVSDQQVISHLQTGYDLGLRNFTLCDSIGIATPNLVKSRVSLMMEKFPDCSFKVHIHDTRNMGMINTLTAIECGIADVEVALGGLGGCPYAKGAGGNTSAEDLVYMLDGMGYDTGIDFDRYLETARYMHRQVPGNYTGHHIMINYECQAQ